jgi:hypothetical protein
MKTLIDTDKESAEFRQHFKREEVRARTILLKERKVSKKAYYIEKGCIRLRFNNDVRDITIQFFFEGQGISSI